MNKYGMVASPQGSLLFSPYPRCTRTHFFDQWNSVDVITYLLQDYKKDRTSYSGSYLPFLPLFYILRQGLTVLPQPLSAGITGMYHHTWLSHSFYGIICHFGMLWPILWRGPHRENHTGRPTARSKIGSRFSLCVCCTGCHLDHSLMGDPDQNHTAKLLPVFWSQTETHSCFLFSAA
jgi:hypothetical protein